MPWGSSVFPLLIVTASGGFTGLFVYSPAPGPGNLVDSITAASGTDPYGNTFQAGITTYLAGQIAQLVGGQVNVSNPSDNNPGSLSAPSGFGGLMQLFSPQTGVADASFIASLYSKNGHAGGPLMQVSNNILATNAGSGAAESWHTMTLIAGFAAGSPAPRYRLEPIGSGGVVRLGGVVALTANQAAGTNFWNIPAAYTPSTNQFFLAANNLAGAAAQNTTFSILSTGTGQILEAGNNTNTFSLDGITYVLD